MIEWQTHFIIDSVVLLGLLFPLALHNSPSHLTLNKISLASNAPTVIIPPQRQPYHSPDYSTNLVVRHRQSHPSQSTKMPSSSKSKSRSDSKSKEKSVSHNSARAGSGPSTAGSSHTGHSRSSSSYSMDRWYSQTPLDEPWKHTNPRRS